MTTPDLIPAAKAPELPRIQASFDPKYIPVLALFAAKSDLRYYLNQTVQVEAAPGGGVYLASTNGHAMVVIHDKAGTLTGADATLLKMGDGLAAACRAAVINGRRIGGEPMRVLVNDKRLRIATGHEEFGAGEAFVQAGNCRVDARFPDFRKVLPNFKTLRPTAAVAADGYVVNPRYLALLEKVSTAPGLGSRRIPMGVRLWQDEAKAESSGVFVQFLGAPELLVIVMPMRVGAAGAPLEVFSAFTPKRTTQAANDDAAKVAANG